MKKYSAFKMIEIVLGLLHVLFFFVIPFATLSGIGQALGSAANMFGMGDAYPEKLTGLAIVKMASIFGADVNFLIAIFTAVFVAGIIIVIMGLIPKRWTHILVLILSLAQALLYGLGVICLMDFEQLGYKTNIVIYLAIVISVVQFVVSIIGLVKEKQFSDSIVKVGKHDGIITGMTGEYADVKVPIKAGKSIKIGRNSEQVNIVVKGESVSREHCEVSYDGKNGRYIIKDLSKFGTFKSDGSKLDKESILTPGSVIQIGPNGDTFRLG
jgi:hypothetical protein